MRKILAVLLPILLLQACQTETMVPEIGPPLYPADTISILSLGDSYTKGQGINTIANFPNQLIDSLFAGGQTSFRSDPVIIAQTGWRTDQLLSAYNNNPDVKNKVYDLVTLCIGVNNQFQNRSKEEYQVELDQLLQVAIERTGNRPERVVVVSIPDWAFTPFGQNYPGFGGPTGITTQIDQMNEIKRNSALQLGTNYVFITDLSRKGIEQPEWVASDGLHPSELQYSAWLSRRLLPVVKAILAP